MSFRSAYPSPPSRSQHERRQVANLNRMLDTAPFTFHGEYTDGCLTRLSTDPLLNVSRRGGSHGTDVYSEKRLKA